jgi:hypothetical protein
MSAEHLGHCCSQLITLPSLGRNRPDERRLAPITNSAAHSAIFGTASKTSAIACFAQQQEATATRSSLKIVSTVHPVTDDAVYLCGGKSSILEHRLQWL